MFHYQMPFNFMKNMLECNVQRSHSSVAGDSRLECDAVIGQVLPYSASSAVSHPTQLASNTLNVIPHGLHRTSSRSSRMACIIKQFQGRVKLFRNEQYIQDIQT
jgi:hypothetical protein